MDSPALQKLNRGYADGLPRGVEIALVPVVFGGLGWMIDNWLGTSPGFTLGLAIFAVVGIFLRMWLQYDASMTAQESDAIWNRGPKASSGGADGAAPQEDSSRS